MPSRIAAESGKAEPTSVVARPPQLSTELFVENLKFDAKCGQREVEVFRDSWRLLLAPKHRTQIEC